MANVENVVKVMNFHSLLRIDRSKEKAEQFFEVEDKLTTMIIQILYNRNLNIDKKVLKSNPNGIVLNVYIGNDLGFCGNFNSLVNRELKNDDISKKIIIGRKINKIGNDVLLKMDKTSFYKDSSNIEKIIYEYVSKEKIKEINVIYNRYYHVSDIRFEKKKIFPLELADDNGLKFNVDYVIETDIKQVLNNILSLYLCYEIKILEANSWASENVMREKVTRESIKKIEDLNIEKKKAKRKLDKQQAFKKQLSNYRNGGDGQ